MFLCGVGAALGCRGDSAVTCGPGTILHDGVCAATPNAAPTVPLSLGADAPLMPIDAGVRSWVYEDAVIDKMRGITAHSATIASSRIDGSPDAALIGIRRQQGGKPDEVLIVTDHGLNCAFGTHVCRFHAKFDDGKVEDWDGDEMTTSGALSVRKADSWIARLRQAKALILELEFSGGARRQFPFSIVGLGWEPPSAEQLDRVKKEARIVAQSRFYCFTTTADFTPRDSFCARSAAKCERDRSLYGSEGSSMCEPHATARCVDLSGGEECMLSDHDCAVVADRSGVACETR